MVARETAQLKGSAFIGYLAGIRSRGLFDAVRKLVPEETGLLMDSPPLAISWVATRHYRDVLDAVEQLRGLDEVRALGAESLKNGVFSLFKPLISGFLRTVGTSPHTVFAKIPSVLGSFVRGYDLSYRELGPTSGEITILAYNVVDSRAALSGGWENAFAIVLELVGVKAGQVRLQQVEQRGNDSFSRFQAKWAAR